MTIQDIAEKIKTFSRGEAGKDILVVSVIILVAVSSFGLGRLSNAEGISPVAPLDPTTNQASAATSAVPLSISDMSNKIVSSAPTIKTGDFVASKRGKKYYPISCSAVGNLSEANKIYFTTRENALAAGYTESASCQY